MRFLIWGAGAIGGSMGALLARKGHDITLVDTAGDHVAAINHDGLRITGPIADCTVRAPAFTPDTLSGTWDTVVLATKAQHTEAATRQLLPHLSATGCVISAQNGLNEITIAAIVGAERTVGAFVNFGADYMEPGVVHYGGRGAVVIGEIDGRITARVNAIRDAWLDFDDRTIVTPNIFGYLWGKEAYGAMLFATALTNESIADALALPAYRDVYIGLAQEILAVAAARGVTTEAFNGFDPAAYRPTSGAAAARSLHELVAFNRRSAKTHSGIWRDLAVRKRPTEVDAQLGIVVALGRASGVATPLTLRVVELIHDIENGTRAQSLDSLDLLASAQSATVKA
jgi:2-dehydropantoate 2-reductase